MPAAVSACRRVNRRSNLYVSRPARTAGTFYGCFLLDRIKLPQTWVIEPTNENDGVTVSACLTISTHRS